MFESDAVLSDPEFGVWPLWYFETTFSGNLHANAHIGSENLQI